MIVERCELPIRQEKLTKSQLAGAIVREAGGDWNPNCWSRGETVTKVGLLEVQKAVLKFRRQRFERRQTALAYFSPSQLRVENDYEGLSQEGGKGFPLELAIAASLMAPDQRAELMARTIDRHRKPEVRRRVHEILRNLDVSCINRLCLPGLPQTDSARYVRLVPRRHEFGPSDLIVYDLRTRSSKVGLSIKEDNLNIKNPGFAALGLPRNFQEDCKRAVREEMIPAWVEEMRARYGDLEVIPVHGGRECSCNWDERSGVKLDFIARTRNQVVKRFNAKNLNQRTQLVRSLFHQDNNPIENFFIVETSKQPIRVKKIIKEHSPAFNCRDPRMRPRAKSYAEIFDNSEADPMRLLIQIKFNSRFFEFQKGGQLLPEEKLTEKPETYFAVNSPHSATGRFILRYRWLASWDVVVNSMPSPNFWEILYQFDAR